MKKWLYILVSLFVCVNVWASTDSLSVAERNAQQGFNDTIDRLAPDFVEAYVSIAEPGDYLYTTLGHAAYHLKCPAFGLDYYFTMEGENSPDAVLRFLAGDLKMGLISLPPDVYLDYYKQENRGVREWKLNLSPEQEMRLWEILDNHVRDWSKLPYLRALRASRPSSLLRTRAVSALIERVRSLLIDSRAVTRIRAPCRIPSFKRGSRSLSAGNGSVAAAIWWASMASDLPTPRRDLTSMRGASATV